VKHESNVHNLTECFTEVLTRISKHSYPETTTTTCFCYDFVLCSASISVQTR